jgi:hypothetical protein
MIITIKDPDSDFRRSYVICLNYAIEERTMLTRAKVKSGSYAGDLVANLHSGIFHHSIELKRDYSKYYSVEYGTFAEYARRRFLFPPDVVNIISTQSSQTTQIIYFRPSYWFLEDNYGYDFLVRLLEPRRTK